MFDRINEYGLINQVINLHLERQPPEARSECDERVWTTRSKVDIDYRQLGIKNFYDESYVTKWTIKDKPVDPEGPLQRKVHFFLHNKLRTNYRFDYDIKIYKGDEAVTLL